MIFAYDVKKDGVMYKAGMEVPTSMPMPLIEEEKEEVEIQKKPSRKQSKKKAEE